MTSFKDLGFMISKDLSRDNHISLDVNKDNNLLGLIKRSVGTTNVNVFSTLYLSLVRPILEYAYPFGDLTRSAQLSGAIWDNIVIQFILVLIDIFVSLHDIFMPEKIYSHHCMICVCLKKYICTIALYVYA